MHSHLWWKAGVVIPYTVLIRDTKWWVTGWEIRDTKWWVTGWMRDKGYQMITIAQIIL